MTRTGTRRAALGGQKDRPFDFDLDLSVFTAAMDKRLAPGPFYTAPIVQGDLDGTGVPDAVTFPRGDLLANQAQAFYANLDPYQFTAIKWWTAETASADRAAGYSYVWYVSADYYARYDYANSRFEFRAGGVTHTQASAIVSGTTYFVVFSADAKHSIDGTNECRSSINNVHSYSGSGLIASAPDATIAIGSDGGASPASAIIEGLTWYRRILTDGDGFGTNIGVLDEIEDIYAAGAGADPTLITGGAFDILACMPTNSTDEELATGPGEMWSMPHADSEIDVTFNSDGGLPGTPFAVEFAPGATFIDCGSGATLDDIPAGGGDITVEAQVRLDIDDSDAYAIASKGQANVAGWILYSDGANDRFVFRVRVGGANVFGIVAYTANDIRDGKFHHVTGYYDDTAKTARVAIDGVWGAASGAGGGVYDTDAAYTFWIGRHNVGPLWIWDGGIAWVAAWSDDHHVAGTDFIPPRTAPAPGGNLVESWHMDEGTGVTVAAQVTVPGNNGTITAGSWSSIWEVEGTPVVPQSVEFFQEDDGIDFASPAALDDLPTADMTIEFWGRLPTGLVTTYGLLTKSNAGLSVGWAVRTTSAFVRCVFNFDGSDAQASIPFASVEDLIWHHFAFDWDQGTLTLRLFLDGVLIDTDTAVGNYVADAAEDCLVNSSGAIGSGDFAWAVGPIRISDVRRYTGTYFAPPQRTDIATTWTLPDANTLLQAEMTDGAGATVTDTSATGANGTITFGATTRWNNTPDMAVDEPGARVFNNGYNIGSDGANDGITDIETVVAETDYVIRTFLSYGQSGRAWPEIYLYDNTGAAQIGVTYSLPRMHDVHTGGAASATLVNANGSFTQQLIGWLAYNTIDGSVGTITAVSGDGTTITAPLAGGGSNDWQNGEEYVLRPPGNAPYARYPIATEAIFVFRTPVACVSMDIKVRNAAGEGVFQAHQCEVYESLLDNGTMDVGAGVPWIPTGWTNEGLDPGDSQAASAGLGIIHSGVDAMELAATAINEGIRFNIDAGISPDEFVSIGAWYYSLVAGTLFRTTLVNNLVQYSNTVSQNTWTAGPYWSSFQGVWRDAGGVNPRVYLEPRAGAATIKSLDDAFAILLDPITITVVPANQANSLEGTGIRVDGRDTLPQPIPAGYLSATSGWIRWNYTPRHDAADAVAFGVNGNLPQIMQARFDANRQINVFWLAANTVRLGFNDGGGGHNVDWNATGLIVTGTTYLMEVRYAGGWMRLYVDGAIVSQIATPINFTAIPNIAYWGQDSNGTRQIDAVIS